MGVGSNPAAWFVGIALFLTLVRFGLEIRKEVHMKKTKNSRKAKQVKPDIKYLKFVTVSLIETIWAIMTSFVAGLVTPSIYAKGAPQKS